MILGRAYAKSNFFFLVLDKVKKLTPSDKFLFLSISMPHKRFHHLYFQVTTVTEIESKDGPTCFGHCEGIYHAATLLFKVAGGLGAALPGAVKVPLFSCGNLLEASTDQTKNFYGAF